MTENRILDDQSLDTLFRTARSYNGWLDESVSDVLIHAIYDLMKLGPTSANSCPARIVFLTSAEAKEKIKPHLDAGNVKKTMTAPVVAVIGHDLEFYEKLGKLFPHEPGAREWFAGNPEKIKFEALRSGTLQGAYLMLAARSLGLDCGPMGGFNKAGVKAAFFPDENIEVNFICAIGYGDKGSIFPRSPRLGFDEACRIL